MTAALRLHERVTRAGQAAAYLGASVPIALLGVLAVLLLVVGAALSVVGIGLPLLVVAAGAAGGWCGWTVARPTASSAGRSRR